MNDAADKLVTHKNATLGIRGRLILGFGAITLLFVIAIGITLGIVHSTKLETTNVLEVDLPSFDTLSELDNRVLMFNILLARYEAAPTNELKLRLNQIQTDMTKLKNEADKLSSHWSTNAQNSWQEIKVALNRLFNLLPKFEAAFSANANIPQTTLDAIRTESNSAVLTISNLLRGSQTATGESVGLLDQKQAALHAGANNITKDMQAIESISYMVTIAGILLAILITIFTTRSIARHINIFREYSSRIASGDLRQMLNISTKDEIGQLGSDLNAMTESLAGITKQITSACHSMVTSLEEVKQAVDTQSSGATEQASSINQITASLEEIEKSSTQTLEKAKTLGEAAERTRERGEQGLTAVQQSIQGMKSVRDKVQTIAQTILDLSNQTQQVGEITAVVNSLAQQSKMLALNASIEAAKAGEAGKGFAVVASEVKNLAEQSEESTAQVQKILEDIRHATEKAVMVTEEGTKGVDRGTDLVEQTGDIVKSLSEVIHETTIASQQIEAAVRQEGVGIEQITAGMSEINQVTASFVASARETTEAIENLSSIAKKLKERVDSYKV